MASPTGPTNVGVAPNVGGLLCYAPLCCVPLLFSLVVVVMEKQSRFLRFHAFQSLLLTAATMVSGIVLWILSIVMGFIGTIASLLMMLVFGVWAIAVFGVGIFMAIKAYNDEEYELPVIGPMAKGWA